MIGIASSLPRQYQPRLQHHTPISTSYTLTRLNSSSRKPPTSADEHKDYGLRDVQEAEVEDDPMFASAEDDPRDTSPRISAAEHLFMNEKDEDFEAMFGGLAEDDSHLDFSSEVDAAVKTEEPKISYETAEQIIAQKRKEAGESFKNEPIDDLVEALSLPEVHVQAVFDKELQGLIEREIFRSEENSMYQQLKQEQEARKQQQKEEAGSQDEVSLDTEVYKKEFTKESVPFNSYENYIRQQHQRKLSIHL